MVQVRADETWRLDWVWRRGNRWEGHKIWCATAGRIPAGQAVGLAGGMHAGRLMSSIWNHLLDWEPLEEKFHVAVLSSKCLRDIR